MYEDLSAYGGRQVDIDTARALFGSAHIEPVWNFGRVLPMDQTPEQRLAENAFQAQTPDLLIQGGWLLEQRRYPLWQAFKKMTGRFLPYNWQVTGSCVGAGGGNAGKTLMSICALRGTMEYRELFWLYPYGKSRQRAGMRGRGEGSLGSTYAEAVAQDGYPAWDEDPSLGAPPMKDNWIQVSSSMELQWSDGAAAPARIADLAKQHVVKRVARCRSSADVLAAIVNGYPCTQASMFGMRRMVPEPQGEPAVRLGEWDGSWAHQTYFDEVWEHPTLGLIFRWGNNWGPTAHGSATGDEPAGGVYLKASTVDRICAGNEVFALSDEITGFPARRFSWD